MKTLTKLINHGQGRPGKKKEQVNSKSKGKKDATTDTGGGGKAREYDARYANTFEI